MGLFGAHRNCQSKGLRKKINIKKASNFEDLGMQFFVVFFVQAICFEKHVCKSSLTTHCHLVVGILFRLLWAFYLACFIRASFKFQRRGTSANSFLSPSITEQKTDTCCQKNDTSQSEKIENILMATFT